MRDKIIAIMMLVAVIGFVAANTYVIDRIVGGILDDVRRLDFQKMGSKSEAELVWSEFKERETYISLTVSHDDLSNIEDAFCDMIGALGCGDTDGADTAKYRLIHSLEHLRRLSGVNIDAII